jgi:hypothetical protein
MTSHKWLPGATQGVARLRCALLATAASVFVLVPAARAVAFGTVEVTKTGPGAATSTITSEPAGIDCGAECLFEYGFGAPPVKLTATAGAGYVLGEWAVSPESTACPNGSRVEPCEISPEAFTPTHVEASFVPQPEPPVALTGGSREVAPNGATVEGTVNPDGGEVGECYFEYGTTVSYGRRTNCTPAHTGAGISNVAVSGSLTGLRAETTYHYRLVAASLGGSVDGEDHAFTTGAAPPEIASVRAEYSQTTARLYGTVDPENSPTTYHFIYGTTTSYGQAVPMPEAAAGRSASAVKVSQLVTGLIPGVTYHYRLVATSANGTTRGGDQSFTTLTLPESRAYELVTPPFKSFNNLTVGGGLAAANVTAISSDGSPLLLHSVPLLGEEGNAGADEELEGTFYGLERMAAGWMFSSLTPAVTVFPFSHEELASPENTSVGLWVAGTPSQSVEDEDIYRREADGTFVNVGPVLPPASTEGPPHGSGTQHLNSFQDAVVGASADLSRVVFNVDGPLWAGDHTLAGQPSLYEYVGSGHSGEGGDVPTLVGVDNAGEQISECGTGLGADLSGSPVEHRLALRNGISRGGSTVFLTAQAGGCEAGGVVGAGPVANGLYARVGTPRGTQVTFNVAAGSQSECAASASCNVSAPVTYQGAASDGSKVFFTAAQSDLVAGDGDATTSLYECELPGDEGAVPAPAGLVNACPDLKAVTVPPSGGANVQSVVAVSEDGSRVYLIAQGMLTSAANEQGQTAQEGQNNLYLWEAPSADHPDGRTAFIATLPEGSLNEAQITPSGQDLVFTTSADLTHDDTSTVAQVFRYDSQSGELARVSVGQDGFDNDGNTTTNPAQLARSDLGMRTIGEDGETIVFQSEDALTPGIHGSFDNVYEWHDGAVYLISGGAAIAELIGMDASAQDIFFITPEQLAAQDTDDDTDLYDARIDGGFPAPAVSPSCQGEECQGPQTSSFSPAAPGSTGVPAIGNLAPGSTTFPALPAVGKVAIAKYSYKKGKLTLSVNAPSNGTLRVTGNGLTTLSKSCPNAGMYELKLSLSRIEQASLRRRHRLQLKVRVGFTPTSGLASSAVATLTIRT